MSCGRDVYCARKMYEYKFLLSKELTSCIYIIKHFFLNIYVRKLLSSSL